MMKLICKRLSIGLVFAFMVFSCSKTHQTSEITQIELSKINSLNWVDVTAVSIDSSLSVKYHGLGHRPLPSNYQGAISQDLWDSLTQELEDLKFKTLDSADKDIRQIDGYFYSLTIHWKGGKRRIWRGEELNVLYTVFEQLLTINKTIKLVPMNQPFSYDNIETGPMRSLRPKPKIDQVKFPPPSHKKK